MDAAEAAALILSWTTAYQMLHRTARVQRGQRVLVQGAAGAVGQALITLGRMAGLELWGTARGEQAALLRELGATPLDYKRDDYTHVVPGGFDVVFDGRVVWLNPLCKRSNYAPVSQGMQAALPHLDLLAGGADLASLEEVLPRILETLK